jgi:uncharacterized Tic20 family protein
MSANKEQCLNNNQPIGSQVRAIVERRYNGVILRLIGVIFRLIGVIFWLIGVIFRLIGVIFRLIGVIFRLIGVIFWLIGVIFRLIGVILYNAYNNGHYVAPLAHALRSDQNLSLQLKPMWGLGGF